MPPMPSRLRAAAVGAVLAAAAAAVALSPAPAAADRAPAGPAWSAAPAPAPGGRAGPGAEGRPYFYLEGAPGTVLKDRLALANRSSRPVTVTLRGTGATGSGAWIAPAARRVKVPPRTRADVPFTVTVPREAAPGDHPGTLLAESGGRRAGVPVHLRVTGPTLSALTVENVTVRERGSATEIHYALVNRGNTPLTPRLALRIDGVFGPLLHRAARTLPVELPPGRRVELTEPWPDPPALDSADIHLTVTAQGGAHSSADTTHTTLPWWTATLPTLALTATGTWLIRRRLRAAGKDTGLTHGLRRAGRRRTGSPAGVGRGDLLRAGPERAQRTERAEGAGQRRTEAPSDAGRGDSLRAGQERAERAELVDGAGRRGTESPSDAGRTGAVRGAGRNDVVRVRAERDGRERCMESIGRVEGVGVSEGAERTGRTEGAGPAERAGRKERDVRGERADGERDLADTASGPGGGGGS